MACVLETKQLPYKCHGIRDWETKLRPTVSSNDSWRYSNIFDFLWFHEVEILIISVWSSLEKQNYSQNNKKIRLCSWNVTYIRQTKIHLRLTYLVFRKPCRFVALIHWDDVAHTWEQNPQKPLQFQISISHAPPFFLNSLAFQGCEFSCTLR